MSPPMNSRLFYARSWAARGARCVFSRRLLAGLLLAAGLLTSTSLLRAVVSSADHSYDATSECGEPPCDGPTAETIVSEATHLVSQTPTGFLTRAGADTTPRSAPAPEIRTTAARTSTAGRQSASRTSRPATAGTVVPHVGEGYRNQAAYLETLHEGCQATQPLRKKRSIGYLVKHRRQLLKNFIVNDEFKLLYCYVPKVSCTQWKKVFGVLAGTLPSDVPIEKIVGGDAHQHKRHLFLAEMQPHEVHKRLRSYRAFLFVRHPLERVVSAYRNKFEGRQNWERFPSLYKGAILNFARNKARERGVQPDASQEITFDKFAAWLASPSVNRDPKQWLKASNGVHNEHWEPVTSLCHPCLINYTLVGHQESLLKDAEHVLKVSNITRLHFPQGYVKNSDPHKTKTKTPEMLAGLEPAVVIGLLRYYYEDFRLFGYRPDTLFQGIHEKMFTTVKDIFEKLLAEEKKATSGL